MSGLTSGIVFHDPEPWAYARNSQTGPGPFGLPDRSAQRIDGMMLHYPRPEYDHHNPILVYFREEVARYGNPAHGDYDHWLEPLSEPGRMTLGGQRLTAEQIDHARRVLQHLKGVYGS